MNETDQPEPIFDAGPFETAFDSPGETSPAPAETGVLLASNLAPTGRLDRADYLAAYSVSNPLTQTALHHARGSGDRYFDGLGGIPRPADSPLVPVIRSPEFALRIGPAKLRPIYGPALTYTKTFVKPRRENSGGSEASVTAGISVEVGEPESGRFLLADYGASLSVGEVQGDESGFDQTLSFRGVIASAKLRLGMGLTYEGLSGDNRELGRDVQRDLATVALTAAYDWTPKTSFEWDLTAPFSRYADGIGSSGLTSTTYVNYAYSPKTTFGLGFSAGILEVEQSGAQTFQQVLARITSASSPVLVYTASFGCEWRKADDVNSTNPLAAIGAAWTPREGTSFSLSVDQRVQNSAALAATNFLATTATLSWSQRLGSRVSLGTSIGYERASYESVSATRSVNRLDRTVFAQAGLTATVFRHFSVSGTVTYRDTESEEAPQQMTQLALALTYLF